MTASIIRTTLAAALLASLTALPARAELMGAQVEGSIRYGDDIINYFLAANGFVPAGHGNSAGQPVTIGDGIEFGYQDRRNRNTADFTGTQLIFTDTGIADAHNNPITVTLSSLVPGLFASLSLADTNFVGLTYGLSGNTITFTIPAFSIAARQVFSATFDIGTAASVPEPSAALLLGAGLLGLGVLVWRRR